MSTHCITLLQQYNSDICSIDDLGDCQILSNILSSVDPFTFPPLSPHQGDVIKKRTFVKTFIKQLSSLFSNRDLPVPDLKLGKILARDPSNIERLIEASCIALLATTPKDELDPKLESLPSESRTYLLEQASPLLHKEEEKVEEEVKEESVEENFQTLVIDLENQIEKLKSENNEKDLKITNLEATVQDYSSRLIQMSASQTDVTFLQQEIQHLEQQLHDQTVLVNDLKFKTAQLEEGKTEEEEEEEETAVNLNELDDDDLPRVIASLSKHQLKLVVGKLIEERSSKCRKESAQAQKRLENARKTCLFELDLITKAFYSMGMEVFVKACEGEEPKTWLQIQKDRIASKINPM
ncbi:hypothetical protein P9112_013133 [Eukaryota sp. TZLM1-RC]